MLFTIKELTKHLKKIGINRGAIIHLKVSLRSIGNIENGADGFIEALLNAVGETGTLVADAFVESFPLPLSKTNSEKISSYNSPSWAGALVNAMIKHPKMYRSHHPVQRFVAIGHDAEKIMSSHTSESQAYEVLRILAEMKAFNLSIGPVNVAGTLHLSVEDLPYHKRNKPKGVRYQAEDGSVKLFKNNWKGGCIKGWENFVPYYEATNIITKGKIGNANAFLSRMDKTMELEKELLDKNPSMFFCKEPACKECRLLWDHSTGKRLSVVFFTGIKILKNILGIKP